jgi:hypothetical protein
VVITQPESIPADLRRFEAKVDGPLWLKVIDALPKTLAEPLIEYLSEVLYREDHPERASMSNHNAIARAR